MTRDNQNKGRIIETYLEIHGILNEKMENAKQSKRPGLQS